MTDLLNDIKDLASLEIMESKPKRGRGRPPGAKNKAPIERFPDPVVKAFHLKVTEEQQRKMDEISTKAEAQGEALNLLSNSHALIFLRREVRLAWLCHMIQADHVDHKVQAIGGEFGGYEIVETPTNAPKFKAMEMLMKALGDFPSAASVHVDARASAEAKAAASGPRVLLATYDNGRGPSVKGGVVDMPETE